MINPEDLRVDIYTSSGGINPHVRILHIPTGTVAASDDTPSQMRNRIIATGRLEEILGTPMGDTDATTPQAVDLLRAWYHWWAASEEAPTVLPGDLHVHTAAFLAASAVKEGRRIRGPGDL